MKRVLFLVGVALLLVVLLGMAQPSIPEPPEFDGPGDAEEVVVTVGEMKRALWYYEQFQITYPEYVRVQEALEEVVEQRDVLQRKVIIKEDSIVFWRTSALVVGGIAGGIIIYLFATGAQ